MKFVVCLLVVSFALSFALWADEQTPALNNEQKLQLQVISQRIEIAQLRAQAAQREFDIARADLQSLLKSLEKDGYTLDLQTLMYVKKEPRK